MLTVKGALWHLLTLWLAGTVHFKLEKSSGLSLRSLGTADAHCGLYSFFPGSLKVSRLSSLIWFGARMTGAHPREQVLECVLAHLQACLHRLCTYGQDTEHAMHTTCSELALSLCYRCWHALVSAQGHQEKVTKGVAWNSLHGLESSVWGVSFALVLILK